MNEDHSTRDHHDWNLSVNGHDPERELWTEFFKLLLKDALGMNPESRKLCVPCHLELECNCFHYTKTNGLSRAGNHSRTVCSKGWIPHTVQDCAIDYINSKRCEPYCHMLGIDVSYLRNQLQKGVFSGKEYTQTDAQIAQKRKYYKSKAKPKAAPDHTGLPSETGGADRAPEMGGGICGGEAAR